MSTFPINKAASQKSAIVSLRITIQLCGLTLMWDDAKAQRVARGNMGDKTRVALGAAGKELWWWHRNASR
jgi:hypothetical protein